MPGVGGGPGVFARGSRGGVPSKHQRTIHKVLSLIVNMPRIAHDDLMLSRTPKEDRASEALERAWAKVRWASFPVYTAAGRPAAGVAWQNRLIIVADPATHNELQICLKNAGGSFVWVTIAVAF